jgi:hypothetical protein
VLWAERSGDSLRMCCSLICVSMNL